MFARPSTRAGGGAVSHRPISDTSTVIVMRRQRGTSGLRGPIVVGTVTVVPLLRYYGMAMFSARTFERRGLGDSVWDSDWLPLDIEPALTCF